VRQTVQTCKDQLRASGTRGIGPCVSAFAKQHGEQVSDSHKSSDARLNGKDNGKDDGKGHGKGADNGNGNGNGSGNSHKGTSPGGTDHPGPPAVPAGG
jgi:hypothetical protein